MSNLGGQLRQIAQRKKVAMETVVRMTVKQMSDDMVAMSPVDTGRFASNWMPGIGSINHDTSAEPDKTGDSSKKRIEIAIASWKMGETLYISNSLPYAQRLENGWSKRAPTGMVGVTMTNFETIFARALSEAQT
ncbi:MAG: HK97 gp10 family phage protein [Burkholderiaceae bacterium]|jgi:hypothetical protein|nr:HK97 gp10 family phage protein [Burkholderiaceae bacterium]